MNDIIKNIEAAQLKADVTEFAVGDTVKVYAKVKEGNRERTQVFDGVGVEKTWPLHSPSVEKIEVIRHGKVRRAKLNYLRDRIGKKAKVKELIK